MFNIFFIIEIHTTYNKPKKEENRLSYPSSESSIIQKILIILDTADLKINKGSTNYLLYMYVYVSICFK